MPMTSDIQNIIFDFGGVLINWDPRHLYRRYFATDDGAMEHFLAEVGFMEWNAHQDKGRPFKEAVAELSSRFPNYSHLIHAFHENWGDSLVGEIPGSVAILKELRQKDYPLYGLSNWSAETFPITRAKYPFFDLFDDIVLSGEVKLLKPDPAIFKLLLNRINQKAQHCLLIDDSGKNIAAAKDLNFQTIHFGSPTQLRAELGQLRILPTF